MKRLARLSILMLVALISLVTSIPARAVPPLPSSFYGWVRLNGVNVPDGTLVQALIDGQVYAEARTQTYEGDSVYALDVPGDDTDSAARDGGREGDVIQFLVGGVPAEATGTWHSATNVNLDLRVSGVETIDTPEATFTPLPTQTAIAVTLAPTNAETPAQASATGTAPGKPTSGPVDSPQPAATQAGTSDPVEQENDATAIPVFVAAGAFMLVLIVLLATRKKKPVPPKEK